MARLLGRDIEDRRASQRIEEVEHAKESAEQKYETLIQRAPDSIFLVDTETTAITQTNEKAAELTGYT